MTQRAEFGRAGFKHRVGLSWNLGDLAVRLAGGQPVEGHYRAFADIFGLHIPIEEGDFCGSGYLFSDAPFSLGIEVLQPSAYGVCGGEGRVSVAGTVFVTSMDGDPWGF